MDGIVNLKGKTILIVEDDDPNYLYLSELLKLKNASVVRSADGLDAFFICMTMAIDIVLMDIKLPLLNGNDAIQLIKKYQPGIPIITVTASAVNEDRLTSIKAGTNAYITKPILPNDILPVINYFLTHSKYKPILFEVLN
jgi:CheY-like chemotaxis protein